MAKQVVSRVSRIDKEEAKLRYELERQERELADWKTFCKREAERQQKLERIILTGYSTSAW